MKHRAASRILNAGESVGVAIANQQCRLEEDEARIPDARSSSEQRKDELRDQRLDAEEKGRVDEDGDCQSRGDDAWARSWPRRGLNVDRRRIASGHESR